MTEPNWLGLNKFFIKHRIKTFHVVKVIQGKLGQKPGQSGVIKMAGWHDEGAWWCDEGAGWYDDRMMGVSNMACV